MSTKGVSGRVLQRHKVGSSLIQQSLSSDDAKVELHPPSRSFLSFKNGFTQVKTTTQDGQLLARIEKAILLRQIRRSLPLPLLPCQTSTSLEP